MSVWKSHVNEGNFHPIQARNIGCRPTTILLAHQRLLFVYRLQHTDSLLAIIGTTLRAQCHKGSVDFVPYWTRSMPILTFLDQSINNSWASEQMNNLVSGFQKIEITHLNMHTFLIKMLSFIQLVILWILMITLSKYIIYDLMICKWHIKLILYL